MVNGTEPVSTGAFEVMTLRDYLSLILHDNEDLVNRVLQVCRNSSAQDTIKYAKAVAAQKFGALFGVGNG